MPEWSGNQVSICVLGNLPSPSLNELRLSIAHQILENKKSKKQHRKDGDGSECVERVRGAFKIYIVPRKSVKFLDDFSMHQKYSTVTLDRWFIEGSTQEW